MAETSDAQSSQKTGDEESEVSTTSTINGIHSNDNMSPDESIHCVNGAKDECPQNNGTTSRDLSSKKVGLFLRPSALSRDFAPSPVTLKPASLNPVSTISNKFANPDEPVESLFNISSKNEKVEVAPTASVSAPAKVPVAVPLSNPDYVFGQNIKDRVVESDAAVKNDGCFLFTSAVIQGGHSRKENPDESSSLVEDAARCEQQRNTKRKYEEVQTTTGEENETNILQIVVKLFAFEGGSWVERGRGSLRLNDSGGGASRIVIRTLGSLRVILNTKIWAGMQVSRASEKSIRTTALDAAGVLRIFLIQASPSDINTLFNSMEARVKKCRELDAATQVEECSSTTNDSEKTEADESAPPAKVAAVDQASSTIVPDEGASC